MCRITQVEHLCSVLPMEVTSTAWWYYWKTTQIQIFRIRRYVVLHRAILLSKFKITVNIKFILFSGTLKHLFCCLSWKEKHPGIIFPVFTSKLLNEIIIRHEMKTHLFPLSFLSLPYQSVIIQGVVFKQLIFKLVLFFINS